MRSSLAPLLVVTDRRATAGRPLGRVVGEALAGGARMIQLREKDLDGGALLALARELRAITRAAGARLLVNERIDVALAAGADGVVLPAASFTTADARALLGPDGLIGRSTHSPAEVARAAAEGADFAILGPIFATPSKAAYGAPIGVEALRVAAGAALPIYAIGGITAANAPGLGAAGAHGVAVIREVIAAASPATATASLLRAISAGG